jgi:hypothetical protein
MNRFFTGLVVVFAYVILFPATVPAGAITTAPGSFISVQLADSFRSPFGFSGGIINTADVSGSAVFGGGVGSGIGESFLSSEPDSSGHISFSTAAYQDFGIFGGAAAIDFATNRLGATQGVRVDALGQSLEVWTITGGVGQGFLHFGWLVSGSTLSTASFGGASDAFMTIDVATSFFPPLSPFGGNQGELNTGSIHGGGFYEATGNVGGPLAFVFGKPVTVRITSIVDVRTDSGGGDFLGGAIADFSHTATLSHIGVTDLFGNPVSDFEITASSGTQYDANGVHFSDTNGAVPEPSSIILWGIGTLFLTVVGLRRRRWARVM